VKRVQSSQELIAKDKQAIRQYLHELRRLLIICTGALVVFSTIGYSLHAQIISIIRRPLDQKLFYSNPAGGFTFVLQISMYFGIVLSMPIVMYQVIKFLRPAMKKVNLKLIIFTIVASILLSFIGAVYAYKLSLPAALKFLTNYNSQGVEALINVNDYSKFFFAYIFGSIITFQLPLLLIFSNKVRRFPPGSLNKSQKPMIIGAIVVAGVITPTADPFNQLLVAVPILFLYELGVVIIWRTNRKHHAANRKKDAAIAATPLPKKVVTLEDSMQKKTELAKPKSDNQHRPNVGNNRHAFSHNRKIIM